MTNKKVTLKDTNVKETPDWCPGCGDFGILMGIKKAVAALERPLEETCIVSGIGCSGKLNHYINTFGFESLHGRALPVAQAIKLSNHSLNVVALGGDGDGYGIGMGHFMHAMRRNIDMTYVVHNNQVYGLTKGQYSPTTECGMKTASSPHGAVESPTNPLLLALVSGGASFIARGFAGNIKNLASLIEAGMNHKGFAFIDILQPCVTFNKLNTYEFFKNRVYNLQEDETFDSSNKVLAMERALEWDERIATGIFYQANEPRYEESIAALSETPLVDQGTEHKNLSSVFEQYL